MKATGTVSKSFDVTTVEISVKDQNDNKPIFSKQTYQFTVPHVNVSQIIGSVSAKDRDRDGQQQILYHFDPKVPKFSIDSVTGEVQIQNASLLQGQYRLHVVASDIGLHPTLESQADILVTVGRASKDDILRFMNSSVVFSIRENPPQDMLLGKIKATSPTSSSANNKITYKIEPEGNPDNAFRIDRLTGNLRVNNNSSVDYELRTKFSLGILASITDVNKVTTTRFLNVLVNLEDVNDNTPSFVESNITLNREETTDSKLPAYVFRIDVQDEDKVDQANLELSIVSGNEAGFFYISPFRSGHSRLYLVKDFDYETQSLHHLVIRVNDHREPIRHADLHIFFNVEDTNDNKPIFDPISPVFVREDTKRDTMIAQVS